MNLSSDLSPELGTCEDTIIFGFCQEFVLYLANCMPVKHSASEHPKNASHQAYIVAVDMGYGHQRAVYPLRSLAASCQEYCVAEDQVINANRYPGIPKSDQRRWDGSQKVYEFISRFKNVPLLGEGLFSALDYLQRIEPFYPRRSQSKPSLQLRSIYQGIAAGWGKHLIDTLNKNPLPLITSFFIPAYFAEEHKYRGEIYLLCCDTDISRAWAPLHPATSRINYVAPNQRVKARLMQYGVREHKITVTGFPLPSELLGGRSLVTLRQTLAERIVALDPHRHYRQSYQPLLKQLHIPVQTHRVSNKPVRITFAIGGAGAQRELGLEILRSLRTKILAGSVELNLVAGVRADVYRYYEAEIKKMKFPAKRRGAVKIIFAEHKSAYFKAFNELLRRTDILWTKPSELSFYAGLGMPIIMAPPIGSQENFNRDWLLSVGAGKDQRDPRYTAEWLFDWIESGILAEAAVKGFLDAPQFGTYAIEDVVFRGAHRGVTDLHVL